MLATRFVRGALTDLKVKNVAVIYRNYASQPREGVFRRAARMRTENIARGEKPLSAFPITAGRGFAAGASVIGIGSLAYYGLGFSNESGFADRSAIWPDYVRQRISNTYQYFGASLGVTAASAVAVARSPAIMNLVMKNSWLAIGASFAALIGTNMLTRSIPYQEGTFGAKQLSWALHAGLVGAFIAPLTLLGGPIVMKAAWYTAGIVGGLSIIAATAPSEKFLNMGGPLSIGLGAVFAASIGSAFLPPTTRLGLSLYSISIYGGIVLFSMFLLYDTQRIVKRSEQAQHYDPVNESIAIYMNTINIFMRMAMILSGGGNRKR